MAFNSVELAVFSGRLTALCREMGFVLQRSALSPNIKDRLDFSCAFFDQTGRMSAQAAHIPVHLGSMAFAMHKIVSEFDWRPGDMVVFNDPFMGGTHLPDVTVVAPVFFGECLVAFVANRAHHANIGAEAAGSMPLSQHLSEEGLVLSPRYLRRQADWDAETTALLSQLLPEREGIPGDFLAQVSANQTGIERCVEWLRDLESSGEAGAQGAAAYLQAGLDHLDVYANTLTRQALNAIETGVAEAADVMDSDGFGAQGVRIKLRVTRTADSLCFDFTGTDAEVAGNINCPLSVTAAAVYYAVLCLLPDYIPHCAGVFDHITIHAPEGCLVNARPGKAVAAGNVETSMRLVDVVLEALGGLGAAVPAQSQGTMNNLAMGSVTSAARWDYYETMAGGMGAGAEACGLSGVQCHMTNTLNTPIESLEAHYPLRVERYAIREASGGKGCHHGGDGLVRELRFLAPAEVTLLTERRDYAPRGMQGGQNGLSGINLLNGSALPAKAVLSVVKGDVLRLESPGGGGWGVDTGEQG